MKSSSDEDAIERCRQGDIRGLDVLAQRYQVMALRLAYLLTGDREQAQDIVQESFIQVYHKIHQFRTGQPFGPWYHRIVINMVHIHLRMPRQHRERSLDEAYDDRPTTDSDALPDIVAERRETQGTLLAALDTLTKRQREAIILRYYLGYTDQEIATLLQCPNVTVRQRLHAGRRALEVIIRQQYPWLVGDGWSLPDLSPSLVEEI